jgi:hypothetical protein
VAIQVFFFLFILFTFCSAIFMYGICNAGPSRPRPIPCTVLCFILYYATSHSRKALRCNATASLFFSSFLSFQYFRLISIYPQSAAAATAFLLSRMMGEQNRVDLIQKYQIRVCFPFYIFVNTHKCLPPRRRSIWATPHTHKQ